MLWNRWDEVVASGNVARRACGAASTPSSTPPGSTRTGPATGSSSGWCSTRMWAVAGRRAPARGACCPRSATGSPPASPSPRPSRKAVPGLTAPGPGAGCPRVLRARRAGRPPRSVASATRSRGPWHPVLGLRATSAWPRIAAVHVGRQARLAPRSASAPCTARCAVARARARRATRSADTKHHGGADQAVYAFAREDLDLLGRAARRARSPPGMFGENLTTAGIDVNEAVVGERWRVGTACCSRSSSVRIPCNDFKAWMGLGGYDNHGLGQAVHRRGPARAPTCGCSSEGHLQAGDDARRRAPARTTASR